MTAIRGWAGLSQGTPLSQLHSQHAQPPGKLAEAVRLRLDPETQLPDLHDASESRQSYHHQERIAEPLAKPRQSADRPDDYWTTSMAKDGTQAPPLSLGAWCGSRGDIALSLVLASRAEMTSVWLVSG
jgi:hypothetical protein